MVHQVTNRKSWRLFRSVTLTPFKKRKELIYLHNIYEIYPEGKTEYFLVMSILPIAAHFVCNYYDAEHLNGHSFMLSLETWMLQIVPILLPQHLVVAASANLPLLVPYLL